MAQTLSMDMNGKDLHRFLSSTVSSFLHRRLLDRQLRSSHRDQCLDRLAADAHNAASSPTGYADQAVLANLDWGIDALEDAISSSNSEAKLARLDHAERMLNLCSNLDPSRSTASVPNSYLSAWAHLNLSYLHKLRVGEKDNPDSVLAILQMFCTDPFYSRIDFAPELWELLFLPHMSSIVGWYTETRHRIVMEMIAEPSDFSMTMEYDDRLFNESVVMSVRPDQAEKLKGLERDYGEALDDNTRMYARYYKEVVARKGVAAGLPPIVEPPEAPLHEGRRRIPDFVKFGPILPKSAGFARPVQVDSSAEESTEETKKKMVIENFS